MGRRNDLGRSLARYVTSRSGISETRWDLNAGQIVLPYPLGFDVVTSHSAQALRERVTGLGSDGAGLRGVIRRDQDTGTIDDSWVVFRLESAVQLIGNYYGTVLAPRLENRE